MKKYLIIAVSSIALSVVIVIQLYKTTDIQFIDDIVEASTKALGVKPAMVAKKIERKEQERKAVAAQQESLIVELPEIPLDSVVSEIPAQTDSLSLIAEVEVKKAPKKSVFNTVIDKTVTAPPVDSSQIVAKKEEPVKPKRKLFNTTIDKEEAPAAASGSEANLLFFDAAAHGAQKFEHNQEVTFRTTHEVTVAGKTVPSNYVFKAKANVFDGKVHFIVKALQESTIAG